MSFAYTFVLAAALTACASPEPPMTPPPSEPTQSFRVGRAVVDLPESVSLAAASGGGTHDNVPIQEVRWPQGLPASGLERDAARAAMWAGLVSAARRTEIDPDAPGAPPPGDGALIDDRSVEVEGAEWARALLMHDSYYVGMMVHWNVVADVGDLRLVVETRASAELADEVLARTLDVLGAYVRPDAPGYGTADWLYLRYGAIARLPAGLEVVRAAFDGHPAFDELWVGTRTVLSAHDEPSLLERWQEAQGVGLRKAFGSLLPRSMRADALEVRAGRRAAGEGFDGCDLEGEEVLAEYAFADGDLEGASLDFTWEHRGDPGDLHDPDVTVAAATEPEPPHTPTDDAVTAWDAIVPTVRVPARPSRPQSRG